jgi:dihydropteroate synthase
MWRCGRFSFAVAQADVPLVMGIVNVTPDSFSDGNQYPDANSAIARGERLAEAGAQILDVGGESTRPGSKGVSVDDELRRVIPVISGLAKAGYCVSVDTKKSEVMRAAIDAGAVIVNDVYALRGQSTLPRVSMSALNVCAASDAGVVLMHMQGEPGTMQDEPRYVDVVEEVTDFLRLRAEACVAAGIARERIAIDPGFGFGKTTKHNIELTHGVDRLCSLGYPLLAGWSRKRSIGELTGQHVASERVAGSVAAALACVARGARIVRVHDVRETVDALKVWHALGAA